MTPRLERHVEAALLRAANAEGVACWKFTSPSMASVPDRIILHPTNGRVGFIEVKRPKGVPTPLQLRMESVLKGRGAFHRFVYTPEEAQQAITDFLQT